MALVSVSPSHRIPRTPFTSDMILYHRADTLLAGNASQDGIHNLPGI